MVLSFNDLKRHIGHDIVCVSYGYGDSVANVAIECESCSEVLLDFDKPEHVKREKKLS